MVLAIAAERCRQRYEILSVAVRSPSDVVIAEIDVKIGVWRRPEEAFHDLSIELNHEA
jgi:hypothetical protein